MGKSQNVIYLRHIKIVIVIYLYKLIVNIKNRLIGEVYLNNNFVIFSLVGKLAQKFYIIGGVKEVNSGIGRNLI